MGNPEMNLSTKDCWLLRITNTMEAWRGHGFTNNMGWIEWDGVSKVGRKKIPFKSLSPNS